MENSTKDKCYFVFEGILFLDTATSQYPVPHHQNLQIATEVVHELTEGHDYFLHFQYNVQMQRFWVNFDQCRAPEALAWDIEDEIHRRIGMLSSRQVVA